MNPHVKDYIITVVIVYIVVFLIYFLIRGGKYLGRWGSFRSNVENETDKEKKAEAQKILNETVMIEIAYIVVCSLLYAASMILLGFYSRVGWSIFPTNSVAPKFGANIYYQAGDNDWEQ